MRLDVLNKITSYEVPTWFCEQENITGHECEQAIVEHLLMYRNKNETKREFHVRLTTIYKICKKRGLRI